MRRGRHSAPRALAWFSSQLGLVPQHGHIGHGTVDVFSPVLRQLAASLAQSSLPFIPPLAALAVSIMDNIQKIKENKEAFVELGRDTWVLLTTLQNVVRSGQRSSAELQQSAASLKTVLQEVQAFVETHSAHKPLLKFFFAGADAKSIEQYRSRMKTALDLFMAGMQVNIHNDVVEIHSVVASMRPQVAEIHVIQPVVADIYKGVLNIQQLLREHPSTPAHPSAAPAKSALHIIPEDDVANFHGEAKDIGLAQGELQRFSVENVQDSAIPEKIMNLVNTEFERLLPIIGVVIVFQESPSVLQIGRVLDLEESEIKALWDPISTYLDTFDDNESARMRWLEHLGDLVCRKAGARSIDKPKYHNMVLQWCLLRQKKCALDVFYASDHWADHICNSKPSPALRDALKQKHILNDPMWYDEFPKVVSWMERIPEANEEWRSLISIYRERCPTSL